MYGGARQSARTRHLWRYEGGAKVNVSKLPYCGQTAIIVTVLVNVIVTVINTVTVAVEVTLFATAHDFFC